MACLCGVWFSQWACLSVPDARGSALVPYLPACCTGSMATRSASVEEEEGCLLPSEHLQTGGSSAGARARKGILSRGQPQERTRGSLKLCMAFSGHRKTRHGFPRMSDRNESSLLLLVSQVVGTNFYGTKQVSRTCKHLGVHILGRGGKTWEGLHVHIHTDIQIERLSSPEKPKHRRQPS